MEARLDLTFARLWAEYEEKNKNDLNTKKFDLIKLMANTAAKKELQAGYPNYHDNDTDDTDKHLRTLLSENNLMLPGISNNPLATWCPFFVYNVFITLKKNITPALNKLGIGYTGAKDMYANLVAKANLPVSKIKELQWDGAQIKADNNNLIIIASTGLKKEISGHVALVAPNFLEVKNIKDMYCAQAGARNGFFKIVDIFNTSNGVTQPRFFYIED